MHGLYVINNVLQNYVSIVKYKRLSSKAAVAIVAPIKKLSVIITSSLLSVFGVFPFCDLIITRKRGAFNGQWSGGLFRNEHEPPKTPHREQCGQELLRKQKSGRAWVAFLGQHRTTIVRQKRSQIFRQSD